MSKKILYRTLIHYFGISYVNTRDKDNLIDHIVNNVKNLNNIYILKCEILYHYCDYYKGKNVNCIFESVDNIVKLYIEHMGYLDDHINNNGEIYDENT